MATQPQAAGQTIIVADPAPTVLRVAEVVLSQAGYEAVCLERGVDVRVAASNRRPAMILLAADLTDIDAADLCTSLGEDESLRKVPIVIMNARGLPAALQFRRDMGVVDHIMKPFAPEALMAVVEHTLRLPPETTGVWRRPDLASTDEELTDVDRPSAAARLATLLAKHMDAAADAAELDRRLEHLLSDVSFHRYLDDLIEDRDQRLALAGNLRVIPVAEVMQLLSLQRQSGFLHIQRQRQRVSIAYFEGEVRLVTARNLPREFLLGSILVQEKRIQQEELDVLLSNRRGTRHRLGTQVVKLGYVSQVHLHTALRRQSAEIVYELLRWHDGRFHFEPREALPRDVLEFEFGLGIDELLMEGFRRVDEWGLIESAIPSFEMVLNEVPGGREHTGPGGLNEEELEVLEKLDGKSTVHDIVSELGWGTFSVLRVLYRLVSARVAAARDQEDTTS